MMLKASQRGGGQNLAVHLMRLDDNEHMELHELRGFVADDLRGAFKEAEGASRGTSCRQYLFSLSLNPPEDARVPVHVFEEAIERIEERLGLEGQPRAIVFHEKEGRRHAHCVWSRIDAGTMTARQLSFFKSKLMGISRDLFLEHGWKMPAGIAERGARSPTNFTLAEWQQAKRSGLDPRWLKETIQRCWKTSDNLKSFQRALDSHSLILARGDKRSFVVVDFNGEVYSLPRQLAMKGKEVSARLGDGKDLPGVADAKEALSKKLTPALRRHVQEARAIFVRRSGKLGEYKAEMTQLHRAAREELDERHKREWEEETRQRAARLPKGFRGLWHRITGLYGKQRAANEAEAKATELRQATERNQLVAGQLDQRAVLQKSFKALRSAQAETLLTLRRDLSRSLSFNGAARGAPRPESSGLKLGR